MQYFCCTIINLVACHATTIYTLHFFNWKFSVMSCLLRHLQNLSQMDLNHNPPGLRTVVLFWLVRSLDCYALYTVWLYPVTYTSLPGNFLCRSAYSVSCAEKPQSEPIHLPISATYMTGTSGLWAGWILGLVCALYSVRLSMIPINLHFSNRPFSLPPCLLRQLLTSAHMDLNHKYPDPSSCMTGTSGLWTGLVFGLVCSLDLMAPSTSMLYTHRLTFFQPNPSN